MAKDFLTDEAVEREIERLSASENVKLAKRELSLKYKRRQRLYNLRVLEKRGEELAAAGITLENLEMMMAMAEAEEAEEVEMSEKTRRGADAKVIS